MTCLYAAAGCAYPVSKGNAGARDSDIAKNAPATHVYGCPTGPSREAHPALANKSTPMADRPGPHLPLSARNAGRPKTRRGGRPDPPVRLTSSTVQTPRIRTRSERKLALRRSPARMRRIQWAERLTALAQMIQNPLDHGFVPDARDHPAAVRCAFDETLRTSLDFLANPCNLWASERLEHMKAVLKLASPTGSPMSETRDLELRTSPCLLKS